MATNTPAYRLTVYAPYSVDPTETTILTPYTPVSGGAIHSDAFKVSTVKLAGWKEYLDIPDGRHGKLNILERSLDTGQIRVRLLDVRAGGTGSNLIRWMTAFVGDDAGAGLMNGRKVLIEESLDFDQSTGLGTWTAYFTGRITSLALDRSRQWYLLQVQDMSADLDDLLFAQAPHPNATTAQAPQVLPVGLQKDWGPSKLTAPIPATVARTASTYDGQAGIDIVFDYAGALTQCVLQETYPLFARTWGDEQVTTLRCYLTWSGGASTGTYRVRGMNSLYRANYAGAMQHFVNFLRLAPLATGEVGYTGSFPAVGTSVTVRVEAARWPVSKHMPVFVNDTHPVTLIKWLIDGYFGDLTIAGAPRRALPRLNPTGAAGDPFYDLEQDASFRTARCAFTETASRRAIIQSLCKQYGLAIELTADGKAAITDVRSKAAALAGVLPALTSTDLALGSAPRWSHSREGAVSRIDANYYVDQRKGLTNLDYWTTDLPDIGPSLIELADEGIPVLEVNVAERALDANGKPISIDCPTFRGMYPGEVSAPDSGGQNKPAREMQLRQQIKDLQEEFRRLFGTGPMTLDLDCRRTATVAAIRPGTYVTVAVDEVPDPTTNRRGGTRLMLCTTREERGLVIGLSFLDCGRNAIAAAPTLSAVLNATDGAHAIDATVGITTAGAVVDYCITSTSVAVRPGDTDARWIRGRRFDTSGTQTIGNLLGGRRVWLRASTRPLASAGFQRPSTYTYLGGTGYLDTTAIAGPTAGSPSNITKSTALLSWSNTNVTDPVRVYLIQSASAPADWTLDYLVATLPPGSTQLPLANLTAAAGSSYTWLARAEDASGSVSAGTGTTFVSTATTVTAPTPRALLVTNAAGGSSDYGTNDATLVDTQGWGTHRYGVQLFSTPPDAAYTREIERAPDVAGSPGTYVKIAQLLPTETNFTDYLPSDGATRWYRQRCTGLGADPSSYSPAVSAKPRRIIGALQMAEGRAQFASFAASDATLLPGVAVQRDTGGPTATFLTKGLRKGTCRHGDAVTFSPAFAGTPVVWFAETRRDQSAAKWGSISQVDAGTAVGARLAGVDVYPLKIANGLGPSGFTARLLMLQKGTPTARNFDFSGVAITTAGGTDASAALSTAPAATDQYTVRFKGTIQAKTNIVGLICRLDVVVAIEYRISNVAAYQEVWRTPSPYTVADSSGSTATYNIDESQTVSAPLMTATGNFRVKVISATVSGTGVTSLSIRGKVQAIDGGANFGVTFYTATNQYASATPDTDDSVEWYAMEGS